MNILKITTYMIVIIKIKIQNKVKKLKTLRGGSNKHVSEVVEVEGNFEVEVVAR